MLDKAIRLAVEAHKGQRDKGGKPYILHPLRLMMKMETEEEMIVAVLHDAVEDSDLTFEQLEEAGFSNDVIDAVRHLTKIEGESYEAFIYRVIENRLARKVKIADIEDNMDLRRIKDWTEKDWARVKKYRKHWGFLTRAVP